MFASLAKASEFNAVETKDYTVKMSVLEKVPEHIQAENNELQEKYRPQDYYK